MDWPDHGGPALLEDIIAPLMKAFHHAAVWNLKPGYDRKDVLWGGLPLTRAVIDADEQLSAAWRRYEEAHGRDFLHVMFQLAVQLGVEQGVRLERTNKRGALAIMGAALTNAGHALDQLRIGQGDERGEDDGSEVPD